MTRHTDVVGVQILDIAVWHRALDRERNDSISKLCGGDDEWVDHIGRNTDRRLRTPRDLLGARADQVGSLIVVDEW